MIKKGRKFVMVLVCYSRGFYTFYVNRKAIALGLFSYTDEMIMKE